MKYLSLACPQMAADQSMDPRGLYAATEAIQQLQVVSGIVSGRDVFTVLPTGFGKSRPTVFGLVLPVEETSIVLAVTPLTAIMKDQVSVASRCTYLRQQARHNVVQYLHSTAHNCIPCGQVNVLDLT